MTFSGPDIAWLYNDEIIDGVNKRTRWRWEGKSKCAFVIVRDRKGRIVDAFCPTQNKPGPKPAAEKKAWLRGPDDLKESTEFQNILKGHKLEFPFLTDTENRVLIMRSLGRLIKNIARALSGGRSRRSLDAGSVKYLLQNARVKIRLSQGKKQMQNISVSLTVKEKKLIDQMASQTGSTRSQVVGDACVLLHGTEVYELSVEDFNELKSKAALKAQKKIIM